MKSSTETSPVLLKTNIAVEDDFNIDMALNLVGGSDSDLMEL